MITWTAGDMFTRNATIRINTVNCEGVMGKGIALLFKERYPVMFAQYRAACLAGELKPGGLWLWSPGMMGVLNRTDQTTIINFATKDKWREPSRYIWIVAGLVKLRDYLKTTPNAIVTIPALGSSNGKLEWDKVKQLIEVILDDIDHDIFVYEPRE